MKIDHLGTAVLLAIAAFMQVSGAYDYDTMAIIITASSMWWISLRKQWVGYQLQRKIYRLGTATSGMVWRGPVWQRSATTGGALPVIARRGVAQQSKARRCAAKCSVA